MGRTAFESSRRALQNAGLHASNGLFNAEQQRRKVWRAQKHALRATRYEGQQRNAWIINYENGRRLEPTSRAVGRFFPGLAATHGVGSGKSRSRRDAAESFWGRNGGRLTLCSDGSVGHRRTASGFVPGLPLSSSTPRNRPVSLLCGAGAPQHKTHPLWPWQVVVFVGGCLGRTGTRAGRIASQRDPYLACSLRQGPLERNFMHPK